MEEKRREVAGRPSSLDLQLREREREEEVNRVSVCWERTKYLTRKVPSFKIEAVFTLYGTTRRTVSIIRYQASKI